MTDTQTIQTAEVVAQYFAMWNEPGAGARREAIAAAWTPGASYLDPLFSAEGADGLDALVAGLHAKYPGHRFHQTDALNTHHDRARWGWQFVGPDGAVVAAGIDVARLAPDGRLGEVIGFFDPR